MNKNDSKEEITGLYQVTIDASLKDQERMTFYKIFPGEASKEIQMDQIETEVKGGLSEISGEREPTILKGLGATFELLSVDQKPFNEVPRAKILLEVNLPYCLHIPESLLYEIKLSSGEIVFVKSFKKWTKNALDPDPQKSSRENDIFAEDREIFFKDFDILSPMFPQKEEDGWQYQFTGKNIEFERDINGHFRYTKMYIYANKVYDDPGELSQEMKTEIEEFTLEVVNQFIEVYRYITREDFVERLYRVNIAAIYFLSSKQGIYASTFSKSNIRNAVINKSKKTVDQIQEMLSAGKHPELYENLLLDAINALNKGNYSICVVSSFQALEIFLENYLSAGYRKLNLTGDQTRKILEKFWKTKDRLRKSLKEITGKDICRENSKLWVRFCGVCNKIRNEVIHKGYQTNEGEAKETLEVVESIINWINSLSLNKKLLTDNNKKVFFEFRFLTVKVRIYKVKK